jgi:hypothetical protein
MEGRVLSKKDKNLFGISNYLDEYPILLNFANIHNKYKEFVPMEFKLIKYFNPIFFGLSPIFS